MNSNRQNKLNGKPAILLLSQEISSTEYCITLACSLCYPGTILTQMLRNEEQCHLQCPVDSKQLDQYFDSRTHTSIMVKAVKERFP